MKWNYSKLYVLLQFLKSLWKEFHFFYSSRSINTSKIVKGKIMAWFIKGTFRRSVTDYYPPLTRANIWSAPLTAHVKTHCGSRSKFSIFFSHIFEITITNYRLQMRAFKLLIIWKTLLLLEVKWASKWPGQLRTIGNKYCRFLNNISICTFHTSATHNEP